MDKVLNGYGEMGIYLQDPRTLPNVCVRTEYHSIWLNNAKAQFLLGWRPEYDPQKLIDTAFDYERAEDDPRKVWYPG